MKNKFLIKGIASVAKNAALAALLVLCTAGTVFAGGKKPDNQSKNAPVTIMVAAAASLKNAYDKDLIPLFQQKYQYITVEGTYDSSGKLQTQIENGLEADIFMSAAVTQMDNLTKGGYINTATRNDLLQNKLALIKPAGGATTVTGFQDITKAKSIVIGDPKFVPAGQYAQEALTKLGSWAAIDRVSSKGTNVTEVLNQVGSGNAEVGIVYATDAASTNKVEIITLLADGILSAPVIYPVAVLEKAPHPAEAKLFEDFLASPEGIAVFTKYGFSKN